MRRLAIALGAGALAVGLAVFALRGDPGEAAGPFATAALATAADGDPMEVAKEAALRRLRPRTGGVTPEIQVMRHEGPDQVAICGQVPRPGGAVPFVIRVMLPPGHATRGWVGPRGGLLVIMEEGPGIAAVNRDPWPRYCADAPAPAAPAPPAVPDPAIVTKDGMPPVAGTATATGASISFPQGEGGGAPGAWQAVVRGPANLRDAPNARGGVLRVAKRGEIMTVRGEAPGGWFRVADETGGEAWVHGSLLEQGAR